MNNRVLLIFLVVLAQFSCKENDERLADNIRDAKKKELIFKTIDKGWIFFDSPINTTSEATLKTWPEWRDFMDELAIKPKKTITAFQKKAKTLSTKVMALNSNVPSQFDTPPIRSRIAALITQVRMLDLYINLDKVSDKKVTEIVAEINLELVSLERQMDKIVEKNKIPMEIGESELLMMLDTTRAIQAGSPVMPGNPAPQVNQATPVNPGSTPSPKNQNEPRVE
ncbi:hypothetical protein [Flavobacterium gilvum]|uniref:Uncharacterized protein n=1 Tax=Flavobacterium gilvum TaxID=1492737 RepID=A0AAC9I382_9FLAO|nr:hypothetical protein [Flavobacterium gilvum]AOW08646.1 hypothetical protein EM308_03555 [Flavobacterium gilvum]KFC59749.1 hypothetical protein FEM08_15300 [Flavobacterium gilvum]